MTANAGRCGTLPPGAGWPVKGHRATWRCVVVVAAVLAVGALAIVVVLALMLVGVDWLNR